MPSHKKVLIVLPVVGKPYIAKDVDAKNYGDIQKIVYGSCEEVHNDWAIHPMFTQDCPKWRWVQNFTNKLNSNQYKLYVNDNGIYTECVNGALIMRTKDWSSLHGKTVTKEMVESLPDKITNIFGRCCIQVTKHQVEKFSKDYGFSLEWRYIDQEDFSEEEEEEDIYADEKAYDEYKGK